MQEHKLVNFWINQGMFIPLPYKKTTAGGFSPNHLIIWYLNNYQNNMEVICKAFICQLSLAPMGVWFWQSFFDSETNWPNMANEDAKIAHFQ